MKRNYQDQVFLIFFIYSSNTLIQKPDKAYLSDKGIHLKQIS